MNMIEYDRLLELCARRIEGASWEYPGFICIDVNGELVLNIGTANGPIDADVVDRKGECLESVRYLGEVTIENVCAWIQELRTHPNGLLAGWKEFSTLDDEERSNGPKH